MVFSMVLSRQSILPYTALQLVLKRYYNPDLATCKLYIWCKYKVKVVFFRFFYYYWEYFSLLRFRFPIIYPCRCPSFKNYSITKKNKIKIKKKLKTSASTLNLRLFLFFAAITHIIFLSDSIKELSQVLCLGSLIIFWFSSNRAKFCCFKQSIDQCIYLNYYFLKVAELLNWLGQFSLEFFIKTLVNHRMNKLSESQDQVRMKEWNITLYIFNWSNHEYNLVNEFSIDFLPFCSCFFIYSLFFYANFNFANNEVTFFI